jgi:TonB family protein
MSLSTSRGCFITVMSLVLAAHGQTQPPASTGLANNPSFGNEVGGEAFRVGGGVSAPIPIFSPDPEYSEEARKAKLQGSCVLWLIVGRDGKPRDIRVARTPLGHGLDEKAMEAVEKWRFNPAYKDGKPVAVQINVEVNFHLNGKVGIKSDLDSAIANYTKAIELKPDDSAAYRGRGEAKYLKSDLDGAIADYTKAIELKPDDSAAYTGRGEAKRSKSDLDGAIADYTKAIEFNPNFGAAYYSRCWARRATHDDAGADADDARAKRLGYHLTCKN